MARAAGHAMACGHFWPLNNKYIFNWQDIKPKPEHFGIFIINELMVHCIVLFGRKKLAKVQ